ncbi:MAG: hypothetical protein L3J36_08840 [Rhodobacteraceae bacterium]|nr:hypothetical protein [Paracoccaceae bacterium]
MLIPRPINPWPWSLKLGYNQAEILEDTTRHLICSGQTAVDAEGKERIMRPGGLHLCANRNNN